MKIGDICSNICDKEGLGTLQTLPGKGLNLGLIERKSAIREEFLGPLYMSMMKRTVTYTDQLIAKWRKTQPRFGAHYDVSATY